MEKLFNCEILDEPDDFERTKAKRGSVTFSGKTGSIEHPNLTLHNFLDYTQLYRKYKEKNSAKSFNKLPVYAYRYPPNFKNANFDELKTEYLYDEINKSCKEGKSGEEKKNGKRENAIFYEGNLKLWIPRDDEQVRQQEKEKKSLRKKIYDGEVMFYEDYIEQQAAKDYEYFFKKPYEIKKKDEGGKYYFYGKKLYMSEHEDIYRKYYNLDDEYFIKRLQLYEELKENKLKNVEKEEEKKKEKEKEFQKEYEKLSFKDQNFIVKIKEENNLESFLSTYKFYKKNKCIFEKNIPEIKKKELLYGHIPDIILPANIRKTKHPKNCIVPLSSLHTYANFIDDLFKCPYIYTAIDAELGKYWKTNENEVVNNIKSEKIKKGYKKDIYAVTKEQLEKSNEKLKKLIQNEEHENKKSTNVTLNFKIPKNENKKKVVSNGRYII
ncbi:hypothetical protein, conserved [Plasmodium gonderi]|uniref:Apical exonemal protein n=1 Tax=Plasmodium gonderi TaxID=77519 RepID=A0A1Y1JHL2_PLAGO|nr:hypothetical protein, conserved [Plasmodium gonderi]GAW81138.1 hypothetical protein, conserved [Plasmodium gonderi]